MIRERFLTSQDHLRQLLKEKDERKKKLIQTINQQKVNKLIFYGVSY
jgi:hypothetical protein